MKAILMIVILHCSLVVGAQETWTDKSRILPDQLRNVENDIVISHYPSPVYPELNTDTVNFRGKFVWKHSTSIKSNETLILVKVGSYIWTSKGWLLNMQLDLAAAEELFGIKKGILLKNKRYTFKHNYRYGNEIYGGDALWYVLARDKAGKLHKGIAIVETEQILKK